MIEGDIGFTRYVCEGGYYPREGEAVTVHCVECKHNRMSWRALSVSRNRNRVITEKLVSHSYMQLDTNSVSPSEKSTLKLTHRNH